DQGEWQRVKFDEFPMAFRGVDTDPEQAGTAAKLLPGIAKFTRLLRASRCLVLRVEVENDLFANIIVQMERFPVSEFASNSDSRKVWSWVTGAQGRRAHKTRSHPSFLLPPYEDGSETENRPEAQAPPSADQPDR